jgi:hypothetical protein
MSILTGPVTSKGDQGTGHRDLSAEATWTLLYRVGGVAALIALSLLAVAIVVFIAHPPPTAVVDWFGLLQTNRLVGLVDMDLAMLLSEILLIPIFLALYVALHRASESLMALGTTLGLVGIVLYLTSNPCFSMAALSDQYAAATTEAQRSALVAAGQATLATWTGTAYDVGYVLGGIAGLIVTLVMLHSAVFSKATAYVGIVLFALMVVPPTVGPIGLLLSFLSLVPLAIWYVLIARGLFRLGSVVPGVEAGGIPATLTR